MEWNVELFRCHTVVRSLDLLSISGSQCRMSIQGIWGLLDFTQRVPTFPQREKERA